MHLLTIESTDSTNNFVNSHADDFPDMIAVMALEQTAGRGQRGNCWEAKPGENITLSIMMRLKVNIAPTDQFLLSQCVSVGVVETLRRYLPMHKNEIAIKWPNDIYVGQRKICGILIENSITDGRIARTIAGIGLNVNQLRFESDAPNPVSMLQLTGKEHDIRGIAQFLCNTIEMFFKAYFNPPHYDRLRSRYFSMLWRRSGHHPYLDTATGERFMARISNIASSGHITLTDTEERQRVYAFKEVKAVGLEPCPDKAL